MHECGDDGDEDPLGCHRRDLSLDSLLCLRRCSDGRTAYEMLSGEYGGEEPLPAVLSFAHVAGKGVAVIATRPVAKGERLVAEAPLLEWASAPASSTGECDWAPLAAAVARLGHARRRTFWALCDKHVSRACQGKTEPGIWNSNALSCEDVLAASSGKTNTGSAGVMRSAVFAASSRFNHSYVREPKPARPPCLGDARSHPPPSAPRTHACACTLPVCTGARQTPSPRGARRWAC